MLVASNPHELPFRPSHAGPEEEDNDMRRQDIQLLASARQGALEARYEVGRRYLLGVEGFSQHTDTGLEYLTHTSLGPSERAARIFAGGSRRAATSSMSQPMASTGATWRSRATTTSFYWT